MSITTRAVLDLAEAWYDCPSQVSGLDMREAVSALRNEPCSYWPSTMWADLQAQVEFETRQRTERGEHLIRVSFDTGLVDDYGDKIFEDAQYLESNAP